MQHLLVVQKRQVDALEYAVTGPMREQQQDTAAALAASFSAAGNGDIQMSLVPMQPLVCSVAALNAGPVVLRFVSELAYDSGQRHLPFSHAPKITTAVGTVENEDVEAPVVNDEPRYDAGVCKFALTMFEGDWTEDDEGKHMTVTIDVNEAGKLFGVTITPITLNIEIVA